MWERYPTYYKTIRPAFLLAFILFNTTLPAQEKRGVSTIIPPLAPFIIQIPLYQAVLNCNSGFPSDTLLPFNMSPDPKDEIFYDSLAIKASRFIVTKKLHDLLVVSGKRPDQTTADEASNADYKAFSGRKIREITIRRLDVFGTWIDNPLLYNPSGIETFLNKTHLNTNEFIIRNNLLFERGDTVSPLELGDNERLLRDLPYIDDSRIILMPVSDDEVDILVLTKDVYSLGAALNYRSIDRGSLSIFEKNIVGVGHELVLDIAYDNNLPDSPCLGIEYNMNNIRRSFVNLNLFYQDGLGRKTYGFSAERRLVSSGTKYAGGIAVRHMSTTEDLDTMTIPEPLNYNLQDYWISRSFLLNRDKVSRIIPGIRYTNNNVFDHPLILPDSYHHLQKYMMILGSVTYSQQRYYKTNLLYGYGRTEDIPYGGLITLTAGREINEFKKRTYAGLVASTGHSIRPLGYFHSSAGVSAFLNGNESEQGLLFLRTNWISNILYLGKYRMRNFIMADYTRGFDRNTDEYITFKQTNGFSGFRNDSVSGNQRLSASLESVLFSPGDIFGFRFAFFAFSDLALLFGTNEFIRDSEMVSGIGLGVRVRNDNLVFKTFQIRLGFYPAMPMHSRVNYLLFSGEQMLKPENFDPGPPGVLPYR
jgi:hypothetical protein